MTHLIRLHTLKPVFHCVDLHIPLRSLSTRRLCPLRRSLAAPVASGASVVISSCKSFRCVSLKSNPIFHWSFCLLNYRWFPRLSIPLRAIFFEPILFNFLGRCHPRLLVDLSRTSQHPWYGHAGMPAASPSLSDIVPPEIRRQVKRRFSEFFNQGWPRQTLL